MKEFNAEVFRRIHEIVEEDNEEPKRNKELAHQLITTAEEICFSLFTIANSLEVIAQNLSAE